MATIIANGCFDLFHEGHILFLTAAKNLGHRHQNINFTFGPTRFNELIVCVNTDESARRLKVEKWGEKYPYRDLDWRISRVAEIADTVHPFDTEDELREIIRKNMPCILVKGPDYADLEPEKITGADIAPVLILDTPETERIKDFKHKIYSNL